MASSRSQRAVGSVLALGSDYLGDPVWLYHDDSFEPAIALVGVAFEPSSAQVDIEELPGLLHEALF